MHTDFKASNIQNSKFICAFFGILRSANGNFEPTFRDTHRFPYFKGQKARRVLDFLTFEDFN